MSELIESIERRQMRRGLPRFRMGDRVRVHFQVVEGTRRRTQVFEGVVIRLQGSGLGRTFTVRKLSFGVGVERTFPLHSPKVERLEIVARGEVNRAKLYYLRGRIGRRARLRERRDFTPEELAPTELAEPAAEGQVSTDEEVSAAEEGSAEQEISAEEQAGEAVSAEDDVSANGEGPELSGDGEQAQTGEQAEEVAEAGQPADDEKDS